ADLVAHVKGQFDAHYRLRVLLAARAALEAGEDPKEAVKSIPPVTKVTKTLTANVLQALASRANLPGSIEAPAWIARPPPWPAGEAVVAPNALVHLPSLARGAAGAVSPPTPRLFATGTLGCPYEAHAAAPMEWLKFLGELWPDDPQAIEALQE